MTQFLKKSTCSIELVLFCLDMYTIFLKNLRLTIEVTNENYLNPMAINHKSIPKDDSAILLICALAITFLLFFVDEGSMTFNWMANVGSWILFIIYAVFIFMGEVFVSTILLRKYQSAVYTLLSVATGSGLGILFVVKVVMSDW